MDYNKFNNKKRVINPRIVITIKKTEENAQELLYGECQ